MPETLPADDYRGRSAWHRDRRAIFAREWLFVGRAAQVAAAGDVFATEVAGYPVLVLRAGDGGLRAFHNVCRHRAGPLVDDGEGHCPGRLTCRYHGWVYDLEGRLLRTGGFGDDPDLVLGDLGLHPVQAGCWRGLLFVNLDPEAEPLAAALAAFAEECTGFDMESFTFAHRETHDVAADWKAYADNYLEGWHIPFIHPALNREIDARRYRVEVGDRYCRHSAPARDGSPSAGRWLWRWPNLALNLYPDGMNVEVFEPVGPGRTRITYHYFWRATGADAELENAEAVALSRKTLDEDRAICEAVQRNLEAGVYVAGRLSPRHEGGVAAFQELVRNAYRRDAS